MTAASPLLSHLRQRIALLQTESGAAVAEHKIDDLCGGGQRPGAGIQQVERRDRVEVGKDRVDPRNAEYAGPQNYDDRRPYRLAEAREAAIVQSMNAEVQ